MKTKLSKKDKKRLHQINKEMGNPVLKNKIAGKISWILGDKKLSN